MDAKRIMTVKKMLWNYEYAVIKDWSLRLFQENTADAQGKIKAFLRGENCQHRLEVYQLTNTIGIKMYHYACNECGFVDSKFIAYRKLTDEQRNNAPDMSEFERVSSEIYTEVSETFSRLWKIAYDAYLMSEDWALKRREVLERDNYQCRVVGCYSRATQVHHLTYERVGREDMEDLVSICEYCHSQIPSVFHD